MKIKHIRFRKEKLDLVRPYTIAYKTVSEVESCFVWVEAENGMVGIGAANPSPFVVGESNDDVIKALEAGEADSYIGRDIREFRSLCEDLHTQFPNRPGIKAALDIAFHDLFTQYLGIPLVKFLGQKIEQLPTSITIGIKSVEETIEEAEEYIGSEFQILKVKLGHSLEVDLERLRKLRERFGFGIGIRVDANQGYSVADTISFHKKTQNLSIELVEQPLPANALQEMKGLPAEVRQTIAADESLVNVTDAWNLVTGSPACGIFNIKLMKCGGIYQALRIAEIARIANCDLMWGCNDESIVSITAALHAAFACAHTKYIDLDGSLDLAKNLVKGGFTIEKGMMRPSYGVGLGVERL